MAAQPASSETSGFVLIGWVFGGAIVATGLVAFFATDGSLPGTASHRSHGLRVQFATLSANRPLAWLSTTFFWSTSAMPSSAARSSTN